MGNDKLVLCAQGISNSFDGKLLRERKQLKAGPSILKHFDEGAVLINWNLLAEGASLSEVCRNNEFNTKK